MGGIRVWQQAKLWLTGREFMAWLETVKDAILERAGVLSIRLPAIVTQAVGFVADEVWPLFWEALAQPVIWLAVAALVFGSQVLSLAELWRKGQPLPGEGARFDGVRQPRRASSCARGAHRRRRGSVGRRWS